MFEVKKKTQITLYQFLLKIFAIKTSSNLDRPIPELHVAMN